MLAVVNGPPQAPPPEISPPRRRTLQRAHPSSHDAHRPTQHTMLPGSWPLPVANGGVAPLPDSMPHASCGGPPTKASAADGSVAMAAAESAASFGARDLWAEARAAEEKLRSAMPWPWQTADHAELRPALERAKVRARVRVRVRVRVSLTRVRVRVRVRVRLGLVFRLGLGLG